MEKYKAAQQAHIPYTFLKKLAEEYREDRLLGKKLRKIINNVEF